jgi:hypothetical protein
MCFEFHKVMDRTNGYLEAFIDGHQVMRWGVPELTSGPPSGDPWGLPRLPAPLDTPLPGIIFNGCSRDPLIAPPNVEGLQRTDR